MLTIQPLTVDRIAPCASRICATDRAEMDAAGIADARLMLADALPWCTWAEEAQWHGEAIAIFGVRPLPGGEVGVPWMLTMQHMEQAQRAAVARAAWRAVTRMRSEFHTLTNWVHCRNARAIRLIQWLGFTVDERLCGPGAEFRRFHWSRGDV